LIQTLFTPLDPPDLPSIKHCVTEFEVLSGWQWSFERVSVRMYPSLLGRREAA